jgi:hypothetical protein
MTKRNESRREALLRADEELRTSITPVLQRVANRHETDFLMRQDSEFWSEARRIKDAVAVGDDRELAAFKIVSAFEEANDLSNEHRLGPIRLAERLLRELGA